VEVHILVEKGQDTEGPFSSDRYKEISVVDTSVHLLGTVKGLVSEAVLVRRAIDDLGPDLVGLHIGKEEMKGLRSVVEQRVDEMPLSSYEKLYALRLSRYGDVQIPPPSLVEAMRICRERSIPLHHLDFKEDQYSDIYTRLITGTTMIRQSLRLKSVARVSFKDPDPASFAVHWDKVANRIGGFSELERQREAHMAGRIVSLASKVGVHLHILEIERLEGILRLLSQPDTIRDKIKY
jgi:hypothetical protein